MLKFRITYFASEGLGREIFSENQSQIRQIMSVVYQELKYFFLQQCRMNPGKNIYNVQGNEEGMQPLH